MAGYSLHAMYCLVGALSLKPSSEFGVQIALLASCRQLHSAKVLHN
uniref:Uncharacterized protein n=1 Tax=Arundo donax TaxID=35708 RepID=A0A0A8YSX5_ARUDO